MLNGHSKFDKSTENVINSFLSHLPSPVCLVAHNGDAYDFPLLKAEMEKVNTPLVHLILGVDSYIGIKNIYKKKAEERQSETSQNINSINSDKKATIIQRNLLVALCKNKIDHQPYAGKFRSAKKMKLSPLCIPSSFSLVNLHNRLFGFPPLKSHGAEADCSKLLMTTAALGQDWLDWEENCYFIEECKAMWDMA